MSRDGGRSRRGNGRDGKQNAGDDYVGLDPGKRTLTQGLVQRRAASDLPEDRVADQQSEAARAEQHPGSAAPIEVVSGGLAEAFAPLVGRTVQLIGRPTGAADDVRAAAAGGVQGAGSSLPHLDKLQEAFGDHDLGAVRAYVGGDAAAACDDIGATGYAIGNDVAFSGPPDLHTAAHEAAHVVQQRAGVHLKGGVGEVGDAYEREADAVADRVVAGESAAPLLAKYQPLTAASRSVAVQKQAKGIDRARYEAIEGRLKTLLAQKKAAVEGNGNMGGADAEIDALVAALHTDFGVRLDKGKILEAAVAGKDMLVVNGRVQVSPSGGEHYMGERLRFAAQIDHVPPGEGLQIGWRWRTDPWGGPEFRFVVKGPAFDEKTTALDMELDTQFWGLLPPAIEKSKGIQVAAQVYIGSSDRPTTTLYSPYISLPERPVGNIKIVGAPEKAIVGQYVELGIGPWTPDVQGHAIDWFVDDRKVGGDQVGLRHKLAALGAHKVRADVHTVRRSFGVHDKTPLTSAETTIEVVTPDQFGTSFLDESEGSPARPKPVALGNMVASGEDAVDEMEDRVDQGGSQQEYWEDRLKGQKERLGKVKELAPDYATAKPLPEDPTKLEPGSYNGPITAALVMAQHGGALPLILHLTIRGQNGAWTTRLIDSTSTKVRKYDGAGATPLQAYESAFETWRENNEYPTGGRIVHRFEPKGWAKGHGFDTYTPWKRAKEWVDGLLTAGAFVAGALLLADPDPTISKLIGGILMAAVVARSSVAIYERIRDGGDVLSSENILDGVAIVTSFIGVGGTVLRSVGLTARNPMVYRAGNWMIMGALAGDAGTLVYVSAEALAQMQAIQGDPTLDDGQKASETLRIMASLFATGAMLIASNKELLRNGLKPTDFVQGKLERSAKPDLDVGSRIDAEYELKQAGKWSKETSKLSDEVVLDQVFTIRSRKEIETTLSKVAKPADVDALVKEFGDEGVVTLARHLGDTRLGTELAQVGAKPFIDAKAAFGAPATARLADAVGGDGLTGLVAENPDLKMQFMSGQGATGSYRWGGTGTLETAVSNAGGRTKKTNDAATGLRTLELETSTGPLPMAERGRYGDVKIDPSAMSPKDAAALDRLLADFDVTDPTVKARVIEAIENARIRNATLDVAGAIKAEVRPVLKEAQAAAKKASDAGKPTTTQDVLIAQGKVPVAPEAHDPHVADAQALIADGILTDPKFLAARTPAEGRDVINKRITASTARDRAEDVHGFAGGKVMTGIQFVGDLSIPRPDGSIKKVAKTDVAPDVDVAYVVDLGGVYAVKYIGGVKITKASGSAKAASDAKSQNARNEAAIKAGDQPFETVTRAGEKGTAVVKEIKGSDESGAKIDLTGKLIWDPDTKAETIGAAGAKAFDANMPVAATDLNKVVEAIWRLAELRKR